MIIIQSNDLITNITKAITENSISKLNLELGKQYLITWDRETHQLSLEQDINKVIYIKNIMFLNIYKVKEDLLNHNLFERIMLAKNINIHNDFFDDYQIYEIRLGLEDNLDVSFYSKPEFNWEQMEQIILALKDKFYKMDII